MGIALTGTVTFWLLIVAAGPYGNQQSAGFAAMALVLLFLVAIADGQKLWKK